MNFNNSYERVLRSNRTRQHDAISALRILVKAHPEMQQPLLAIAVHLKEGMDEIDLTLTTQQKR